MSWKLVSRIQPTQSTRVKIETAFCHNESNRPLDAQGYARAEPRQAASSRVEQIGRDQHIEEVAGRPR